MASILKVDTISGKTTAGSISITGEGNSTTTNLQQGLTKAWLKHDAGDASIKDSLNHSSTSDIGTGRTQCNLTSAMSTANNSCTGVDNAGLSLISNQVTMTTSTYSSDHFTASAGSYQDAANCSTQMCGDLA